MSLVWWDIPEMVVLRMLRQEDNEVKTTLGSVESFKQAGHITRNQMLGPCQIKTKHSWACGPRSI